MDNSKHKLVLSIDKLIIVLLFLFSIDLFDMSGILITLCILMLFVFYFKRIKIDKNVAILFLFSLSYFASVAFFERASIDSAIKFAVAPWGCYILGYNLGLSRGKNTVIYLCTLLAVGFYIHGMLNLYSSIRVYGSSFNNIHRLAYDFWQNRQISVTTAALYYSPLALMSVNTLFSAEKTGYKFFSAIVIATSLYTTLIYQNRTLVISLAIVLLINLYYFAKNKNVDKKRKIFIVGVIIGAFLFFVLEWNNNIFQIKSFIEKTTLFSRFTSSSQDRTKIWTSFIFGDAWKYPFGGNKAVLYANKPYVHNLWLDVFRRTGIIPFLFLVIFTFRSIIATKRFVKISCDTQNNNNAVLSLLSGLMVLFFVEPIIEANPYIFFFPIIIIGAICSKNEN